jgi:hypothetical protein
VKAAKREVDLGPPVLAWLAEHGWTAYQEVDAWAGRADIVATCGPLLAVIEMKTVLSFELLWQARRWRGVAHLVWVAVPIAKPSDGRRMAEVCFDRDGIGLLEVCQGFKEPYVGEKHRPALNRRAEVRHVRDELRPGHQHQTVAGQSGNVAGRWTPFRETCDRLRAVVGEHPGIPLGDALRKIDHHYASHASAKAHLVELIRRKVIKGLQIEKVGRAVTLHLVPEAKGP